jgi:acyl-CoA thioester hydrolase
MLARPPRPEPRHAESGWKNGWYLVPHEVTWRDLDGIGHVNNAVYFTYFEWARTKYWFDLHGGGHTASDLNFIVARAECDFRRQLGLAERIDIAVRIGALRNSSLDFEYEVRTTEAGDLAATGKVVVVLYSWESNSKQTITDELRRKVRAFQGEEADETDG